MDFPELDGNQKIALAALALAALAALLFLTAQAGPQDGAQNATRTTLLQTEIIANPPLVLRYGPNESAELLEITNNGTNPSDFDLYSIVPSERASAYSLVSVDNKPPSPGESAFLSDRVAFRDSMLLAPNGVKTKSFGFQKSGGSPLYLITKPAAAANETEKFKALLRKIADLGLTQSESSALQKRLNDVLAAANFSTELLDSLDAFVDAVKNATETRITNPDYNATGDITRLPMPTPRPAQASFNATEVLEGLLKDLPDSIEFKVSEASPYDSVELVIPVNASLGEVLYQVELTGPAKDYVTVEESDYPGVEHYVTLDANVRKAKKDGVIPFDERLGKLRVTVGLPKLVAEASKEVAIKIKVTHELPDPEAPLDEEITPVTVPTDLGSQTMFSCPLTAEKMTSGFGPRDGGFHNAIDLKAALGTPVKAAAGGVVEKTWHGTTNSYPGCRNTGGAIGTGVQIRHKFSDGSEYTTRYIHLSAVYVKEGDAVTAGQTIGAVGNTGCSSAAHLDFRITLRTGGYDEPVNPVNYVGTCDGSATPTVWHEQVWATQFCDETMASSHTCNQQDYFVALPHANAVTESCRNGGGCMSVEVRYGGKTLTAGVWDVGPCNEWDYGYVFGTARPATESGERGTCPSGDKAAIDLSPALMTALGLADNAYVDWRFAQ